MERKNKIKKINEIKKNKIKTSISIGSRKVDNVLVCSTLTERMRGLMFRRPQCALLAHKRETKTGSSVHMLFVFFPIDVVWLNKEWRIIDFKKDLKPFISTASPKEKAMFILEVPVCIRKSLKLKYSAGEQLHAKPSI